MTSADCACQESTAGQSGFPVPAGRFWAKLDPREHPMRWHPLIAHSADVAAVFAELLAPASLLARRLAATLGQEDLSAGQRARLVFLAALHDIGKTGHGFQTKARPPAEHGNYTAAQRGHVQTLLSARTYPPLRELITREIVVPLGRDPRALQALFFATIAHHGRPWLPPVNVQNGERLWKRDVSGCDPLAEMRRLVRHARTWSGVDEHPEGFDAITPGFTHLYAGLLTLADWIGSTTSAFPFAPEADDDPDGYWLRARGQAEAACAAIGVVPCSIPAVLQPASLLETLFPATFGPGRHTPTALQRYAAEMPLPPPGARLLIESETGSGKTEAALALYARLRAAGLVAGLVFALPTRATASAMYERVNAVLDGLYPGDGRPTVALAIGGQQPQSWSSAPQIAEPADTWDDDAEAARLRELRGWATASNKKHFAAEIVVGTMDQVLLAGLPVQHAHLRLAALTRHLLVVDELHSFDRYMSVVLARVLELHHRAGGLALFMSATLSSVERARFAGGPEPDRTNAERLVYPTLSVCERPGAGWTDQHLPSDAAPKRVQWLAVTEADALTAAVAAAKAGARVCVLCNTVARARATVAALQEAGHLQLLWRLRPESEHTPPYHSRYTRPDRNALDDAVRRRFGKSAAAEPGGVILVATQVIEQSLDVDFDLLVTDLCPVDALLQRIGRLHRHRERDRHRPDAYALPRALVIAPKGGSFAAHLARRNLPLGWGENRPYRNYADGELTLQAISHRPSIEIPRDNRRLVEAVYHPEAIAPFWADPAWEAHLAAATGDTLTKESHGNSTALDFDVEYSDDQCVRAFDNAREQNVRTRLGDETVRIPLSAPVQCWFGQPDEPVCHAELPAWALQADAIATLGDTVVPLTQRAGVSTFQLGGREYRYTPTGWEWSGTNEVGA